MVELNRGERIRFLLYMGIIFDMNIKYISMLKLNWKKRTISVDILGWYVGVIYWSMLRILADICPKWYIGGFVGYIGDI